MPLSSRRPAWLSAAAVVAISLGGLSVPAAYASSVSSAVFSGGTGTVSVGGTLYAKQGAALTLTVSTSADTQCVDVAGAFTGHQTSTSGQSAWTFTTSAGAGDGAQAITATASRDVNKNNNSCTGPSTSLQASYTLDNTGPVVTSALTPAPNTAGWNNSDVTVKWTATDSGSGGATAQPFQTDGPITANGIVTKTAPAQTDRLGNTGAPGSVTVRVDKAAPGITAAETKNPDGTRTIAFTCSDPGSGGGQASGIKTCLADGSATNSKTVAGGVTVTGTAIDNAGNKATTSFTSSASDTTPPALQGAPTAQPDGTNGWYQGNVTIDWTCSDNAGGSGLAAGACPADDIISSEGQGLSVTRSLSDIAGNTTTATSSPAVKIDKTAPTTGISGTSNSWVNGDVTLTLTPSDNLSRVASTSYSVDGGPARSGTSIGLSAEGDHTVTYFSTDNAGNVEATNTAHVRIDKTAPTIRHDFTPSSYNDGAWTNQDVKVTFTCADQGGSGVATCTAPVTKSTEGERQQVVGTAGDNAGNSATDTASVSIDRTAPKVTASASGNKNDAGWYKNDVTVSFSATDGLSGVASKSADKVLGEGENQSASGSATDAAGNTGSDSVSGIDVDETKPVLSASFDSGWHTGDVTVTWSCTDALSGVAAGPDNDTVTGEGDNLSSTASCTDKAGNTATKTVDGIKIDRSAPTTTASVPEANENGWYGDAVEVTLNGSDNLSDVVSTYYSVDDGARQTYDGAFSFGTEGEHTITFWSKDGAGNTETAGAPIILKIDKTAPTTTVVLPETDSGWYVTSGIPVAFDAADAGSGIAATYYTIDGGDTHTYGAPFDADLSTGRHTITYWSVDLAGNEEARAETNTVPVNVDTIAPTIHGSQSPAANPFGWNNTDVKVSFTCDDADSGIDGVAGCAGDTTLTNDGAGQQVHGDAVDVAGNRSGTDFGPVDIDKVKPTLRGVLPDANGAGWYHSDVKVSWVGDDALSGIDEASQPADSIVTGEGSDLSAGPATIEDRAGNVSNAATVSGIMIDRTAPDVSGGATTSPNSAGWYNHAVTVDFHCTDSLSGVASCPTSRLLDGNGADQSVTSDPATDVAGNESAGRTVGGIDIDGTAPTTTSNNTCTAVDGFCTGDTADVVLNATDQAGLSGVKEIHYVLDGGTEHVAAGSTTTVSVPLSGSGAGTVRYWAVDNAGNVEQANGVALKWDNIAPTVSHSLSPEANANGWNNTDTKVTFSAKDDDMGSGVASVSAPVTVSSETAGQVVTGTAKDKVGNLGTDSVTVKLDRARPSITAAVTSGVKGGNGWYTGPVTVTFTCSDTGSVQSGVATCPDPVVLSTSGANQASGTVTDRAGNTDSVTLDGIMIDQEKPTITTSDVNVAGQTYTLGAVQPATCKASDSVSGLDSCKVTVTGGNANGVGAFTYTATATDKAGNASTVSGTYKVVYRFDGFLQPINDTAHQVGTSTSVFKAGSTVPAKFQLKKADGTVVQGGTASWLVPVKGSAMSTPVDETVYTATADSGSTYKYDATAQQYQYNWQTGKTAGSYWRIGVTLDDGQTYSVNIGLR
jgi:hypothetical protein